MFLIGSFAAEYLQRFLDKRNPLGLRASLDKFSEPADEVRVTASRLLERLGHHARASELILEHSLEACGRFGGALCRGSARILEYFLDGCGPV